jgi:hypothetical protein
MSHTDARVQRSTTSRGKKLDSPIDGGVAAFSAHTSAVLNGEGVSKLVSKRANVAHLEPQETDILSIQREFKEANKYSPGLMVSPPFALLQPALLLMRFASQLSDEPPYIVESTSRLKDVAGESVKDKVSVGDKLLKIGDFWVGQVRFYSASAVYCDAC